MENESNINLDIMFKEYSLFHGKIIASEKNAIFFINIIILLLGAFLALITTNSQSSSDFIKIVTLILPVVINILVILGAFYVIHTINLADISDT